MSRILQIPYLRGAILWQAAPDTLDDDPRTGSALPRYRSSADSIRRIAFASFGRIRYRHHDADVFMWAFDLIELNGGDLRRDPLAVRKATLASVLARAAPGLRFNEHLDEQDGPLVFAHACKLGLEGIVSKRKDSSYRSGRSPHWIKSKNPNSPAVKREAEEEWGR
jgi:ATP-dependent DNA ligase